jgi:hypothetical protein
MRPRFAVVVVALVALLTLNATVSLACSCMLSGPACQAFWPTGAVFDGTVVSIEQIPREMEIAGRTMSFHDKLVKLDAHRSWKGVDVGPVEVVTGQGGGDCGFDFVVGERYLVFAHKGPTDGRLHASICTLTQRFAAASDAVTFLDSLSKPSAGGRIFGSVELFSRKLNTAAASNKTPMELTVRLSGGGREYSMTSKNGRYEFRDLPPAQYRIDLSVPDGYSTYSPGRNVEIPDPHACAEESYAVSVNGRIAGQLLLPDGRGADKVHVQALDADVPHEKQYQASTFTIEGGYFEFKDLPPGRYVVGLSLRGGPSEMSPYARTVYPETIALAFGNAVQLEPWRAPQLAQTTLNGTLVWRDGAPAPHVVLDAWDVTDKPDTRFAGQATTDGGGRFSVKLWEGRSYALMVSTPGRRERMETDVTPLSPKVGMAPVRVTILGDRPVR